VQTLLEARTRFAGILGTHLVLSMAAQGVTDRVAQLAEQAGLPGLERELVKSDAGTAEFELVRDLCKVAQETMTLDAFLTRHGYHGRDEGLLEARVWREDPAPLIARVEAYRSGPRDLDVDGLLDRRQAEQRDALARLTAALGPVRSLPAGWIVRFAAQVPGWRETGRASILRAVDVARAAARSIGRWLAERGALEAEDDVYFLTVDEVGALGGGRLPASLRETVADRRSDHAVFASVTLPQIWRGAPVPVSSSAVLTPPTRERVEGLGVSSGVAEGTVHVVLDQNAADLGHDAVLVCRVTDPSWAALFPLASAVVTDVGSSMSHAAIVCRELGIPCVANTRTGTFDLCDGMRVRVDGNVGVVEVIGGI
jgi:phosphohistidine swiveling domain-containing protein